MSDLYRIKLEDALLGILHGRDWGMTLGQILDDPAWSLIFVTDHEGQNFDAGCPGTTLIRETLADMAGARTIQALHGQPVYRIHSAAARRRADQIAGQILLTHENR